MAAEMLSYRKTMRKPNTKRSIPRVQKSTKQSVPQQKESKRRKKGTTSNMKSHESDEEEDLPKLSLPKRRRMGIDQHTLRGVENNVKAGEPMERIYQEFPRHNWLENKYKGPEPQTEHLIAEESLENGIVLCNAAIDNADGKEGRDLRETRVDNSPVDMEVTTTTLSVHSEETQTEEICENQSSMTTHLSSANDGNGHASRHEVEPLDLCVKQQECVKMKKLTIDIEVDADLAEACAKQYDSNSRSKNKANNVETEKEINDPESPSNLVIDFKSADNTDDESSKNKSERTSTTDSKTKILSLANLAKKHIDINIEASRRESRSVPPQFGHIVLNKEHVATRDTRSAPSSINHTEEYRKCSVEGVHKIVSIESKEEPLAKVRRYNSDTEMKSIDNCINLSMKLKEGTKESQNISVKAPIFTNAFDGPKESELDSECQKHLQEFKEIKLAEIRMAKEREELIKLKHEKAALLKKLGIFKNPDLNIDTFEVEGDDEPEAATDSTDLSSQKECRVQSRVSKRISSIIEQKKRQDRINEFLRTGQFRQDKLLPPVAHNNCLKEDLNRVVFSMEKGKVTNIPKHIEATCPFIKRKEPLITPPKDSPRLLQGQPCTAHNQSPFESAGNLIYPLPSLIMHERSIKRVENSRKRYSCNNVHLHHTGKLPQTVSTNNNTNIQSSNSVDFGVGSTPSPVAKPVLESPPPQSVMTSDPQLLKSFHNDGYLETHTKRIDIQNTKPKLTCDPKSAKDPNIRQQYDLTQGGTTKCDTVSRKSSSHSRVANYEKESAIQRELIEAVSKRQNKERNDNSNAKQQTFYKSNGSDIIVVSDTFNPEDNSNQSMTYPENEPNGDESSSPVYGNMPDLFHIAPSSSGTSSFQLTLNSSPQSQITKGMKVPNVMHENRVHLQSSSYRRIHENLQKNAHETRPQISEQDIQAFTHRHHHHQQQQQQYYHHQQQQQQQHHQQQKRGEVQSQSIRNVLINSQRATHLTSQKTQSIRSSELQTNNTIWSDNQEIRQQFMNTQSNCVAPNKTSISERVNVIQSGAIEQVPRMPTTYNNIRDHDSRLSQQNAQSHGSRTSMQQRSVVDLVRPNTQFISTEHNQRMAVPQTTVVGLMARTPMVRLQRQSFQQQPYQHHHMQHVQPKQLSQQRPHQQPDRFNAVTMQSHQYRMANHGTVSNYQPQGQVLQQQARYSNSISHQTSQSRIQTNQNAAMSTHSNLVESSFSNQYVNRGDQQVQNNESQGIPRIGHDAESGMQTVASIPPQLQSASNMCFMCGKASSMFLCSSCKRAWYCSHRCQLKHWETHSKSCHRMKTPIPN